MTKPRDPEEFLGAYLAQGMETLPDRVVDAVLDEVHRTRQRAVFGPWRTRSMSRTAFGAAGAVAVLVIGGIFYVTGPPYPAIGGPSPTPGPSVGASQSAGASTIRSPAVGASPPLVATRAPAWTATGSMARHRSGGLAVLLLDGRVLVIGGISDMADPAAELYDPATGTWSATDPMVMPRWQSAAARLLDGRVLVVSGAGDPGVLASAELFDPTTASWTATGSLATARYDATATVLPDGRVLVAGGDEVTHSFNPSIASAELYDPVTGSWTTTGSMGLARAGHTATLLPDGHVLVAGGANDNDTLSYRLATAELYDPVAGTWAPTGAMADVRQGQTATPLRDGRVLVVGGWGTDAVIASAELYDPTAGAWTVTGSLSAPLQGFTATVMSDGAVLVAGGMDLRPVNASDAPATAAAALYDPATGTWTAAPGMLQARSRHTATLLQDGAVLVAGGISVRGSYSGETPVHPPGWLVSAERYDPTTVR